MDPGQQRRALVLITEAEAGEAASWAVGATSGGANTEQQPRWGWGGAGRGRASTPPPPAPAEEDPSPGLPARRRELPDVATRWQHRRLLPSFAPGSGPPGTGSQTPRAPPSRVLCPPSPQGTLESTPPTVYPQGPSFQGLPEQRESLQYASCCLANPSLPKAPGSISVPARQAGGLQDHQAAIQGTLSGGSWSLYFLIWGRARAGACGPGSGLKRGRSRRGCRRWGQGSAAGWMVLGPALSPGALEPLGGGQGEAAQV